MKYLSLLCLSLLSLSHGQEAIPADKFQTHPLLVPKATMGVLAPVKIDGTASHLAFHSQGTGIVLLKSFCEQAKLRRQASSQELPEAFEMASQGDTERGRIDQLLIGNPETITQQRGKQAMIIDSPVGPQVELKKKKYGFAGWMGVDYLHELGPTFDFKENLLHLPKRKAQPGDFASITQLEGRVSVMMARDRRSGHFFITIDIRRKKYAFLVDLQNSSNQIDSFIAKQMALSATEIGDRTFLKHAEAAERDLNQEPFEVAKLPFAGKKVGAFRIAGSLGLDFFRKHEVAIDFSGPVALFPALDEVED